MSDTTVAPPSAAPTTPAAPAAAPVHETPINTNQPNIPNPVGPQAPDRSPAEGRRDAIQRAFDRANRTEPKAAPPKSPPVKAAEARPGHNNPPEETPQERIDLRKRPADQPRGDRGQFAPRPREDANVQQQTAHGTQPARGVGAAQPGQPQSNPLPPQAPFREPPPRMADRAKAEWHAAPESVRGEVHRMNQEFANAYNQYRGDHEVMNSIRPFHDLAAKHKTTLQRALTSYVTMENRLRADPIAGLDQIVNNLGIVDPQSGQRIGLRDIAYHVLTRSPEQLQQLQQGNAQQAATQQIGSLHREISDLKNAVNQMHTQQQFGYTRSAIDQFAESRPRFDELGDLIHAEVQLGFDLETAYRRAELLRPATHAAQTRTPPAQTRPVDRSIYGAPDAGPSNGTQRHREPSKSPREAVQRALRQLNGSI